MATARASKTDSGITAGRDLSKATLRNAVPARRQAAGEDPLLGAANRLVRTLGAATSQIERMEGRARVGDPPSLRPTRPRRSSDPGRPMSGGIAAAELRVQDALVGVLVALRDMGLPRGRIAASAR